MTHGGLRSHGAYWRFESLSTRTILPSLFLFGSGKALAKDGFAALALRERNHSCILPLVYMTSGMGQEMMKGVSVF